MTEDVIESQGGWPLRPVLLGVVGALACVAIQQIGDPASVDAVQRPPMAAIAAGALAFGFTVERRRFAWSVIFAVVVALVAGLVMWWSGAPGRGIWWAGGWNEASLLAAIAIAAPLFQTARDQGSARFPYAEVHAHVWTDIVLWCASWAFVGVTLLLAFLLSALFELIGIQLLRELLEKEWFDALLIGGAFGAALGLFRERERIVRTLRSVVTAVLSVLAPVLGAGLALFLLALPFTGLDALWQATKQTTPILLTCAFGAWVLANTVIGDGAEDEASSPALRWGAIALGVVVLPLGVIAGIATGLRIDQYGVTPERLWAVVFDAVAIAVGLAYWVALARRRLGWTEDARRANLRIAFGVAGLALFLATPILSFNALSAHDQVARLKAGKVTADEFDWAALAFDFGEPGRRALGQLTLSANASIGTRARAVQKKNSRYEIASVDERRKQAKDVERLHARLRVLPQTVPVPDELLRMLSDWQACGSDDVYCTLLYKPGADEAIAIREACIDHVGDVALTYGTSCGVAHYSLMQGVWTEDKSHPGRPLTARQAQTMKQGFDAGAVEIRSVERRQVFVGGVPVGDAFE